MKSQTIGILLAGCASLAAPLGLAAQQQSLAEKARQIREKEKNAPQAKMVWTNQNLPTTAALSIVGRVTPPVIESAATPQASSPAQNEKPADAAQLESELAKLKSQLEEAKKDLKSAKKDLDLAQRLEKLDSAQHYSTPDYESDQAGKAKLDADEKQVTAKQADVDAKQKKVDDLQKKVDDASAKLKAAKAKPDTSQS